MNEAFSASFTHAAINAALSREVKVLEKLFQAVAFAPSFGFLGLPLPFSFTYHLEDYGKPLIRFGADSGPDEMIATIVRFIELLPLLHRISKNPFDGQVVFNLGDHVGARHIGFCSRDYDAYLIPDVEFVKSRAYRDARQLFAAQPLWKDRSNVPFWRGSSTGVRLGTSLSSLPRAKLCQLGKKFGYDFAISAITQARDNDEGRELHDVMGDHRPASDFIQYKYNIDIDGNTSAWSALFLKLLSGSAVLKVGSPQGFKQWYYDFLIPWVNFVPIETDMSDLRPVVEKLRSNPDIAEKIGQRGRQLALGLTWDQEMSFAERTVFKAMMQS